MFQNRFNPDVCVSLMCCFAFVFILSISLWYISHLSPFSLSLSLPFLLRNGSGSPPSRRLCVSSSEAMPLHYFVASCSSPFGGGRQPVGKSCPPALQTQLCACPALTYAVCTRHRKKCECSVLSACTLCILSGVGSVKSPHGVVVCNE